MLEQKWGITYKDLDYAVLNYLSKKPINQQVHCSSCPFLHTSLGLAHCESLFMVMKAGHVFRSVHGHGSPTIQWFSWVGPGDVARMLLPHVETGLVCETCGAKSMLGIALIL